MANKVVISELPPYFLDLDAPTLQAFEADLGGGWKLWRAWCDHCGEWHDHGAGRGHRVAHCRARTPYSATGYNLEYAGPWRDDMAPPTGARGPA